MLGPRVVSAAILAPAVLLLLWLGPETTALTTAVAAVIGVWEFYHMAERSPYHFRPLQPVGYVAAAAYSLAGYLDSLALFALITVVFGLVCAGYFWYGTQVSLASNYMESVLAAQRSPRENWALTFFAALYAGIPLGLVTLVRAEHSLWWIVLMCVGTWGADTGGYFFGRFFGRHKLAPAISPKKTVEGAVGGILVSVIGVSLIGVLALNIPVYLTIPLGLVLAVASIAGDLFESWVKRRFDTKDSGKLIPGHGGLLDRIDSFLAVALLVFIFTLFYH